jgi:hypothetical protein
VRERNAREGNPVGNNEIRHAFFPETNHKTADSNKMFRLIRSAPMLATSTRDVARLFRNRGDARAS